MLDQSYPEKHIDANINPRPPAGSHISGTPQGNILPIRDLSLPGFHYRPLGRS